MYQIQRTDQFHPFKVLAMQLWHHCFYLTAIQHSHQDRLNHIIKMMSQCNFIASKFFRLCIQISSSHTCTKITWIPVDPCYCIKNICFKYSQRNPQKLCIILDNIPVVLIVSRIHDEKYRLKMDFAMLLYFLDQLGKKHGILSS